MSHFKNLVILIAFAFILQGYQNCAPSSEVNFSGNSQNSEGSEPEPNSDDSLPPNLPATCDPAAPFAIYLDPDQNLVLAESDFVASIHPFNMAQSLRASGVQVHLAGDAANPTFIMEGETEGGDFVCRRYIGNDPAITFINVERIMGLFSKTSSSLLCWFSTTTAKSAFTINSPSGAAKSIGTVPFVIRRGCI